jgi:hypothetical protein
MQVDTKVRQRTSRPAAKSIFVLAARTPSPWHFVQISDFAIGTPLGERIMEPNCLDGKRDFRFSRLTSCQPCLSIALFSMIRAKQANHVGKMLKVANRKIPVA